MTRTVQDVVREIAAYLQRSSSIPEPARDARLIVANVLDKRLQDITLMAQELMSEENHATSLNIAMARKDGEPLSHILGYRDFYEHRFSIDHRVLDPRPETELAVDACLERQNAEILDLGTGSGVILLSVLAKQTSAVGIGVDISPQALEVAEANARAMGLLDRVAFWESDWFTAVDGTFDLIVSNPPYIALDEMADLGPELSFEPRIALTDEGDGLSAYRKITAGAGKHLTPGGRLVVEIGYTQGDAVRTLFQAAGLENVELRPDLDGRDRVVMGQKAG